MWVFLVMGNLVQNLGIIMEVRGLKLPCCSSFIAMFLGDCSMVILSLASQKTTGNYGYPK